jgi:glycosyltransferase involved in cell wall biosynthesis
VTTKAVAAGRDEANAGTHSGPVIGRRLLIVCSHVVQYNSPIFRRMSQDPRLHIRVAYCSMQGAEAGFDPEFGLEVAWDTPVLEGYPWIHVPNRSPFPGLGRLFGLFNPGLWKLIRDSKLDAVLVSGYFYASAWIAIMAAKWYGVGLILNTDAYGLRSLKSRSVWKLWPKRLIVRGILSLGQAILGMSSGGVEYLKSLGLPEKRVILAPNVVDNEWWSVRASAIDRNEVRARWGIPLEAPVVLFCAKLQPWKRPLDVLEALARAGAVNAYVVYAGDGPLRKSLEDRARALGISKRVCLLGFVNQSYLPAVYCASDLLVLPSEYDAFGLVVNEAMLCGLPVVISDRVGAKFDLVRSGENGYIFPAGDVAALADILSEILPSPEKRAQMGVAARRRMESWSPREHVEALVKAVGIAVKSEHLGPHQRGI